jgi:glutaredoxin-dependent peroxiredoxin
MVSVGAKAPDFTLTDTALQPLPLSSLKGKKVVLLFFPLAFSSVCTKEMCALQDDYAAYTALDAQIIGISVDSPFVLRKFKEDNHLDFLVLSDFNRTVTQTYGVSFEGDFAGMTGFSKRASFVVDGEGVVRYAEIAPSGQLPDFEAIQAALRNC